MLEGNEKGGKIARRVACTLCDSKEHVISTLCFLDSHIQLQDLTTRDAFLAYDTNKDGWISPRCDGSLIYYNFLTINDRREFRDAMRKQGRHTEDHIERLLYAIDSNGDGKVEIIYLRLFS